MPAEILSLDLDWFNGIAKEDLGPEIRSFVARLKKECVLPKSIDFVPEHHYLYPWSVKLLDGLSYRKMNVINIDEHHDFYCLGKINFDSESAEIGCWNFFAFMVYHNLMGKYTWVTNFPTKTGAKTCRTNLWREINETGSMAVRRFKKRIEVVHLEKVFDTVRDKVFDGFMIVRSPEYTENYRSVYHALEEALQNELPQSHVRRYQCRTNYKSGLVHHRANRLFWEI